MNSHNFLKIKNFKIEVQKKEFTDVEFMTATEKLKIYKNFVSFLNNHFKPTLFKKNLYEHFHMHCGFIAHYNIHGFYAEYFETAAVFHKLAHGFEKQPTENDGFYLGNLEHEGKDSSNSKEAWYSIYSEINEQCQNGLGAFYYTIISNRNYGGYSAYSDLDNAIKEAFCEYLETWRLEIRSAIKAFNKWETDSQNKALLEEEQSLTLKIEQLQQEKMQLSKELEKKAQDLSVTSITQTDIFDFL